MLDVQSILVNIIVGYIFWKISNEFNVQINTINIKIDNIFSMQRKIYDQLVSFEIMEETKRPPPPPIPS